MGGYVVRRTLWVAVLLASVCLATFAIFYVLPSADPALARAGRKPTPARISAIRHDLRLDRPLTEQLYVYGRDLVLHFDLGHSYEFNAPVRNLILERLPATLSLTAGAVLLWLIAGVAVGTLAAARRGGVFDRVAMGVCILLVSAPVYWLGLVALYLFASDVGRLPLLPGYDSYVPISQDAGAWLGSLILPWLVLAATFAAVYARLLRGSLLDVLDEDHVRTARAKGLSERRVLARHAVPSAVTPLVTVLGLDIGVLLGGAVLTESVFQIPGIGRLAFDAIARSDLPTVQGTVLFGGLCIVVATLLVDLLYALLDPRVRLR